MTIKEVNLNGGMVFEVHETVGDGPNGCAVRGRFRGSAVVETIVVPATSIRYLVVDPE